MKPTTLALLSAATLALTTQSLASTIVYQDTFDNDGIATNAGVGGGMISGRGSATTAIPFEDTGDLVSETDFGNQVAWVHTANQFDLSAGFTLELTFTTDNSNTFPSFTSSFGIVDEVTAAAPATTGNLNAFMNTDQADLNAVGFSATTRNGFQGLNADFGTLSSVSTALNSAINLGTQQTFVLTVNTDGSGTASLDGTSVNLAAGTFSGLFANSTDDAFYFAAYSQGNQGLVLNEVTISVVPEPGSLALLGVGGLLVARRRRG